MKILIINQHTLNFGDDIAGISLIQNLLKISNVETIDVIYNTKGKLPFDDTKVIHNQDIMLKEIGMSNLIKYFCFRKLGKKKYNEPLNKMIKIINEADYIFVSPCGANIGIYKDWRFLVKLLIVISENKKPIFHLNTIGKSGSFVFDYFAKKVLKKSVIYVREKKSLEYINSLGLNAKFGVDTAFSYNDNKNTKINNNILAFVPTPLKSWHPNFVNIDIDTLIYDNVLPEISDFAKKNKLTIKLIPHLKSDEEEKYYKKIEKYFNDKENEVINAQEIENVYDYYNAIKNSKMVIGMRYHSIVLAIKNNRPFISLSYENKMQEVCEYANKSECAMKLYDKCFDKETFRKKLDYVFNNSKKISSELEDVVRNKLISLATIPLEQITNNENGEKNYE